MGREEGIERKKEKERERREGERERKDFLGHFCRVLLETD
jgi:hypothetical protein